MASPSDKTVKHLFAMSGNVCAFPKCNQPLVENAGTVIGEICHIKGNKPGSARFDPTQSDELRHAFTNLILLCGNHHKLIDSSPGTYSTEILLNMKADHENSHGRPSISEDIFSARLLMKAGSGAQVFNHSGNVAVNSPGAVQANTIVIKGSSKKVSIAPPPGTIGSDQILSRYISYLIARYNEFAKGNRERSRKFSYAAISVSIARQFGSKWQLLPAERFTAVCSYLQSRIDKTIPAKLNRSRGHRAYSTFEEHLNRGGAE